MEYTHDEYCDMLLTLGAYNSRAGIVAREYALRYPGRRHPDADVFRRLEQRLRETGSATPTALVNAAVHGLYWLKPMKMPYLQL
jgi:hypothetical protein